MDDLSSRAASSISSRPRNTTTRTISSIGEITCSGPKEAVYRWREGRLAEVRREAAPCDER